MSTKKERQTKGRRELHRRIERRNDTAIVAHLTRWCNHCTMVCIHAIRFCGTYRLCAECRTCGQHDRMGGRIVGPLNQSERKK